MFARILFGLVTSAAFGLTTAASAQQAASNRPYDCIQAGLDAFRLAEEQRQGAVAQQLYLNDQMRFWNGYPTSRGETIYYGYLSPAAMTAYGYAGPNAGYGAGALWFNRANLDYTYAYGAGPLWSGNRQSSAGPLAVFQPWPYVPGDIYGYPARYQAARQSVGQQQTQTGPNRWESHPVYDPPLTLYHPTPPVDSPLLDRTPYATPRAELPPPEAIPPGPPALPAPSSEFVPPPPPTPSIVPRSGPREY